ncbi:TOBE domain-containing protein [Phenylobacterium sp.]|uniref:TOBE domain-containing protein n=1 Tax=Phenylobacterium sp. TaxID=1871053 RepID=UPI0035AEE75B
MDDVSALVASLTLRRGAGARVGAERIALLEAVAEFGSISGAAKRLGLSYKGAWDAVQALNNLFDAPLIAAHAGGRSGGEASLTPRGRAVVTAFRKVEAELASAVARLEAGLAGADVGELFWSLGMRTSARNALRGVVSAVTEGAVNAEVVVEVAPGVSITAMVTRDSVRELGLRPGAAAIALIKSSFITLAVGEGLRTSARNQLAGVVSRREDGAVNSEIALELADGKTLTATITRESAEALDLKPGDAALALIKAPHVILAVE